jgi:hypothetical protein
MRSHPPHTGRPAVLRAPMTFESTPAAHATGATDIGPLDNPYYGCQVAELYNEERPHDSLGRVPPLTFMPRPTKPEESNYPLSA